MTIGVYTDDYTTLNKNYFLGHILDENGAIERIFACGIKDEVPFCIEGTSDGSKYLDNKNVLDDPTLWNKTCYYRSGSYNCSGTLSASSGTTGGVSVGQNNPSRGCGSNGYTGGWFCYEYEY